LVVQLGSQFLDWLDFDFEVLPADSIFAMMMFSLHARIKSNEVMGNTAKNLHNTFNI
jgi:hypothetical protein